MRTIMQGFISLLGISLVLFLPKMGQAQCLPAGNYTIDATQPPSASNYQSFNDAVAALACGIQGSVTFTVAYGSGPYNEQVTLPPVLGASAAATVTFDGQHPDSTLLVHDASVQYATFLLNGADHIVIKNLTVQNTSAGAGFCIQLTNAADSNTIRNVKVLLDPTSTNSSVYGIVASASLTSGTAEGNNANYLWVDSVTITGGYGGIRVEGAAANLLKGNRITNCHITLAENHGILFDDSDSLIIHGNYVNQLRDVAAEGLYLTDTRGYFEITANKIFAPDWGIYITNANANTTGIRALVANNFVKSTDDIGLYMTGGVKVNIYHNTIVGTTGARFATNTRESDVRNNIFVGLTSYAYDEGVTFATSNPVDIDHNIYYSFGSFLIRYNNTVNYTTLTDWQTAYPALNQASLNGHPVFYGSEDFHILDTLPSNKGDNSVGVLVDIDGQARPMAPSATVDIGADEYTPFANNIEMVGLWQPRPADCGDSTSVVSVIISNQGSLPQTGFTILAVATGPNGTSNLSSTYVNTLAPWAQDTVGVGNFNNYTGGTYTFQLAVLLPNDGYPANDTLTVTLDLIANLGPPSAVGDTGCVGDALELSAGLAGYIGLEWYDDALLQNNVGSGEVFFTPTLAATDTFYVQAQQGSVERGAKSAPTGTPTNFVSESAGWGQQFVVVRDVVIDSVTVYPFGTGTYSFNLYRADGSGPIYTSQTFSVVAGAALAVQVPIEVALSAGSYVMGIADTTGTVSFLREQSGAGGPFVSPSGFVTVVGGRQGFTTSPSPGLYYWFYDWVIRIPSCLSDPVPVVAFISDSLSDAGMDSDICIGETATLTAQNGVSWQWSNLATSQSIQVSPANSTTYSLTIADANGCPGRPGTVTVNVNPLPNVYAGTDSTICDGQTAGFTAIGADTYVWSDNTVGAVLGVQLSGDYIVTGTDTNGCVNTDTVTVFVNALPIVSAGADTAICAGGTATLNAAGALNYEWSNSQATVQNVVTVAGSYTVTGTDANGCTATADVEVTVNALPTVDAGADQTLCDGATATLQATGADTYVWSSGDNAASIAVAAAGNYIVTGTDVLGCENTDTVSVAFSALPLANAGTDKAICEGETATLLATGGTAYEWSTTENVSSISVSPTTTTAYVVTVTNAANCEATDTVTVTVNPLPVLVFELSEDSVCHNGGAVSLTASPIGGIFTGPGVIDSVFDFSSLNLPGSFNLQYQFTDLNGCANTASADIFVDICQGLSEVGALENIQLYPNPFDNEVQLIFNSTSLEPVTIQVFNMLGQLMFIENQRVEQNYSHFVLPLGALLDDGVCTIVLTQGNQVYRQQLVHIK